MPYIIGWGKSLEHLQQQSRISTAGPHVGPRDPKLVSEVGTPATFLKNSLNYRIHKMVYFGASLNSNDCHFLMADIFVYVFFFSIFKFHLQLVRGFSGPSARHAGDLPRQSPGKISQLENNVSKIWECTHAEKCSMFVTQNFHQGITMLD